MDNYRKDIYYYKKPRHIYAIMCNESFINLIDPQHIKFKPVDDWFVENHWPLLVETLFKTNKIQHEITLE